MRPVAAAARVVRTYALAVAAAGAVIVYAVAGRDLPDSGREVVLAVVVVALVAAPPVALAVLAAALRALAELPGRIRAMPTDTRARYDELLGLLGGTARARGARGAGTVLLLPWRLFRLSDETRALLTPYAPVLPLLSVPFLVACGVAALAGLLELATALVVLVWLAVS